MDIFQFLVPWKNIFCNGYQGLSPNSAWYVTGVLSPVVFLPILTSILSWKFRASTPFLPCECSLIFLWSVRSCFIKFLNWYTATERRQWVRTSEIGEREKFFAYQFTLQMTSIPGLCKVKARCLKLPRFPSQVVGPSTVAFRGEKLSFNCVECCCCM